MTALSSPRGLALVLVVLGIAAMFTGSVLVFATHEPVWRFLIAAGGIVQFTGWLRHGAPHRGDSA
ncbi:hypothetical protein [Streptomyces sp. NRRL WC-3618]|uniref:hypothetical protein n=1 Tax=Streptomyces sp. NRRL WC-3618 TaxID=1519490 RepID=UPI000A9D34AF|nr:hypothetical protein [Streptomyces sp. NRRL WC-3618]